MKFLTITALALFANTLSAYPQRRDGPDRRHDDRNRNHTDPVFFENGLGPGKRPEDNVPVCNSTCVFPLTTLNSTTMNYVTVGRFRKTSPSLEFWLNYTCPEGVNVKKLRIGERQGLSHLLYNHVNTSATEGGFNVKMWGSLALVGKTSNWTVGLRQENCYQEPVNFLFETTNPLNLTRANFTLPKLFGGNNCTDNPQNGTMPISVNVNGGGEYTIDFNSTQELNLRIAEIGYDISDRRKPNRDKKRLEYLSQLDLSSVGTNLTDLPANVSVHSERDGGKQRLRFRVRGNQTDLSGSVCVAVVAEDPVLDVSTTSYVALSLVAGSSVSENVDAVSEVTGSRFSNAAVTLFPSMSFMTVLGFFLLL